MNPRPSVARFARGIVRAEAARGGAGDDGEIAQRVLTRLHQELGKLIGPAGLDVLLARSVVLARRAHPVLVGVTAGPGGKLAHTDDVARDRIGLQEGSVAIISQFIELLVMLIGEDLGFRLVGDIWPAAAKEETK